MGVNARGLGSPVNGLPEWRPYVYRGTGRDTGPRLPRKKRVARQLPADGRCRKCGYLPGSPGHRLECGSGLCQRVT
jgi:hypothetical protein